MRKKFSLLTPLIRLYFVQVSGILAVGLGFYYGLEYFLSLAYLFIIVQEIRKLHLNKFLSAAALYVLWQGIALLCSALLIGDSSGSVLSDNAVFILQFWSTPLYPWFVYYTGDGGAGYYALLYWPWSSFFLYMGLIYSYKLKSVADLIHCKSNIR